MLGANHGGVGEGAGLRILVRKENVFLSPSEHIIFLVKLTMGISEKVVMSMY
jgi:hypothetical protein